MFAAVFFLCSFLLLILFKLPNKCKRSKVFTIFYSSIVLKAETPLRFSTQLFLWKQKLSRILHSKNFRNDGKFKNCHYILSYLLIGSYQPLLNMRYVKVQTRKHPYIVCITYTFYKQTVFSHHVWPPSIAFVTSWRKKNYSVLYCFLMFPLTVCVCLSVCLSVCIQFISKSYWPIMMKLGRMMNSDNISVPFEDEINRLSRTHTAAI